MSTIKKCVLGLCAFAAVSTGSTFAQLRIVTYNAATDTNPAGDTGRAGLSTVLQAIGIESIDGFQKPIDVLSLQETTMTLGGAQSIVNILNNLYGAGTYARSTVVGSSTDGTTLAVIYNTKTVNLVGQVAVGTASTSGEARAPMRFQFQPVGYDSSADFYIYSDHYKAGTASSDQTRRNIEAQNVRADADSLGAGARVIFSGDYNIESSAETMYQTLTGVGSGGPARVDPLNKPGAWNNNVSFASIDTQAPLVTGVNGLTGGGMDDRFDFQLTTAAMQSGTGVSLISGSYHAFGNNGTTFNGNINDASNTALPAATYAPTATQPTRTAVLNALTTASDHLPLVADYQVPAAMTAALATVPTRVIKGSSLNANVSVSNSANVVASIGADTLAYQVTSSGAASGTGSGLLQALTPAAITPLALDTATTGVKSGSVSVSSSSVAVANGSFSQAINYTVLDHASPALVGSANPLLLTLDFGTVAINSAAPSQAIQISNGASQFRAALDLIGDTELDDPTGRFSTDLTPFSSLAPGDSSSAYDFFLNTSQPGSFSAEYLLNVGDEAGAFGGLGQTLEVDVEGSVVGVATPEPSSIALALMAAAGALVYRRRRAYH